MYASHSNTTSLELPFDGHFVVEESGEKIFKFKTSGKM
jgi:hypothetical protein